ncbi:hypothetical protein L842_5979 [Mycobacterium intracellulare MIN_052511_1280]|nr:hypothetical protein L842_5979 [Mycobacterium intracellulare MIN_052511_1280]
MREIFQQAVKPFPLVTAAKTNLEVVRKDRCHHLFSRRVPLF